jgi:hypothetical protein
MKKAEPCSGSPWQGFSHHCIGSVKRACALMLALWFEASLSAQSVQNLSPEEWLWAVKSATAPLLRSVPDYICLESIVAQSFGGDHHKPDQYDSAQVEIAFIADQEWYALPGERRFSSAKLSKLLSPVMATTGLYSSLPRGLMGASVQGLQFVRRAELGGEPVALFRFDKSNDKPSWTVELNGRHAMATEQGSFWAGAETLLLKRVSVDATRIKPDIGLKKLHVDVQYDVRSLSEKRVLLPSSAQVSATESDGNRYVSDVLFTHCRAYRAESSISFGAGSVSASTTVQPLPAGIRFSAVLSYDADWPNIEAHHALVTTVSRPVSWKGRVVVPAGAVLEGSVERVRWLPEYEVFQVVFEFDKVRFPDGDRPFYGRVLSLSPKDGIQRRITELDRVKAQSRLDAKRESITLPDIVEPDAPGLLTIYLKGRSSFVRKGLEIEWQTCQMSTLYRDCPNSPQQLRW